MHCTCVCAKSWIWRAGGCAKSWTWRAESWGMPYLCCTAPDWYLNPPKANQTHAKLVLERAMVHHFPMWSSACQSKPHHTSMGAWNEIRTVPHSLVCNMSYPGVGCNTLLKSIVTRPDHVVRCCGSQECGSRFVNFACQFHRRWHRLRITLKSTTLLFMRSNVWTTKPWQRS